MLTRPAVTWVESVWGRRVDQIRALTGGWTSTVVLLTARDGEQAVLRVMTKEPWRRHAAGLLGRESAVQQRLESTPVPAPRSIAVDPSGEFAGDPAHLMSLRPGRLCLTDASDERLDRLAATLRDIHEVDERPRDYQSWAPPGKRVVPVWTRRGALWERAFGLLEQPSPAYAGRFLHRDFHLGNVLWSRGRVSGVVDWVETSWGPAALDVAHAATYLAMLHGAGAAESFAGRFGGSAEESRYWNVLDIVGYLPDPVKVVQPWRDAGREISAELARNRLEERLDRVLSDR